MIFTSIRMIIASVMYLRKKPVILLCIAVALSVVASYMAYVAVQPVREDLYFSYTHVPVALICFLAFFVSLVASVMYLWKRNGLWFEKEIQI